MTLSERAEEILEHMWTDTVEESADDREISVIRDDAALTELVETGLLRLTENRAALTEKGHEAAAGCIRRHRLAERLLSDVLDMRKSLIHETSCGFEHLLHKGLDENVCTLLGHPRTCPHGKPVPEGACCREARTKVKKLIGPLSELRAGDNATVAYLHTHNGAALQKLIAMGILPKSRLTLLQCSPTLVVQMGRSQFAMDNELASHVIVRMGT
jgi:DtxR family Mn-dependent transcriptional regulator